MYTDMEEGNVHWGILLPKGFKMTKFKDKFRNLQKCNTFHQLFKYFVYGSFIKHVPISG